MIPTADDLQGTWVSRNFPMYQFEDDLEFTFHFGKYATLYFSNDQNNRIIAKGILEIEDMGEENFNLTVERQIHGIV